MQLRTMAPAMIACGLAACGGGSSSGPESNPLPAFTVSTSTDAGLTLSPATMSVEQGRQATFTVITLPGRGVKALTGCGGQLSGNTYTTAPITSACAITGTSKPSYSISAIRLKPNALFHDEFATAPVLVEAVSSGAAGLKFYVEYLGNWFDHTAPSGIVKLPLFDDGTHGDRVANDGIYSAQISMGMTPLLRYHDRTVDRIPLTVYALDDAGNFAERTDTMNTQVNLGVVHRSLAVTTVSPGAGVHVASHMVNIVLPSAANHSQEAMKKVYQYFPDVFDGFAVHLVGTTSFDNFPGGAAVRTGMQGTNQPVYDGSSAYGSSGVLFSSVYLNADIIGEVFNHEFGHATNFWLNKPQLDLTDGTGYHVGPSTVQGQMGNSVVLRQQASGDFLTTYGTDDGQYYNRPFADIELYLMGLLPPASVGHEYFVLDKTVNTNNGAGVIIPRDKVAKVSIGDVIRVYGERLPSVVTSQKSFRFVFIAMSETPATPAEIAIINRVAAFQESASTGADFSSAGLFPVISMRPFRSATKGLGEMTTRLPGLR